MSWPKTGFKFTRQLGAYPRLASFPGLFREEEEVATRLGNPNDLQRPYLLSKCFLFLSTMAKSLLFALSFALRCGYILADLLEQNLGILLGVLVVDFHHYLYNWM